MKRRRSHTEVYAASYGHAMKVHAYQSSEMVLALKFEILWRILFMISRSVSFYEVLFCN